MEQTKLQIDCLTGPDKILVKYVKPEAIALAAQLVHI